MQAHVRAHCTATRTTAARSTRARAWLRSLKVRPEMVFRCIRYSKLLISRLRSHRIDGLQSQRARAKCLPTHRCHFSVGFERRRISAGARLGQTRSCPRAGGARRSRAHLHSAMRLGGLASRICAGRGTAPRAKSARDRGPCATRGCAPPTCRNRRKTWSHWTGKSAAHPGERARARWRNRRDLDRSAPELVAAPVHGLRDGVTTGSGGAAAARTTSEFSGHL